MVPFTATMQSGPILQGQRDVVRLQVHKRRLSGCNAGLLCQKTQLHCSGTIVLSCAHVVVVVLQYAEQPIETLSLEQVGGIGVGISGPDWALSGLGSDNRSRSSATSVCCTQMQLPGLSLRSAAGIWPCSQPMRHTSCTQSMERMELPLQVMTVCAVPCRCLP